ncbi:hypothetical protein RF11_05526 [Thelohanellus kitauei]|uniref:Uncharacterized protein n=1 Tax=Thelohanellus kitauei TaxID=669202 RepID=A0A0C2M502_THEKT|nr:hypothetical protein RF11_05526 [Thelohanellus kitauei]
MIPIIRRRNPKKNSPKKVQRPNWITSNVMLEHFMQRLSKLLEWLRENKDSNLKLEILDTLDEVQEILMDYDSTHELNTFSDLNIFLEYMTLTDMDIKIRAVDCISSSFIHNTIFKFTSQNFDLRHYVDLIIRNSATPEYCIALIGMLETIVVNGKKAAGPLVNLLLSTRCYIKVFQIDSHICHLKFMDLLKSIQTVSNDLFSPLVNFDLLCVLALVIVNDNLAKSCVSILLALSESSIKAIREDNKMFKVFYLLVEVMLHYLNGNDLYKIYIFRDRILYLK